MVTLMHYNIEDSRGCGGPIVDVDVEVQELLYQLPLLRYGRGSCVVL